MSMNWLRAYISTVDAVNYRIGRVMMYGLFVMMGVLLWSSLSKTFFSPSLWTLEMAQFAMVTYYILGGPYAIQMGSNVRMDLFYHNWTPWQKAQVDAVTVLFLIFYLGVLFWGAVGSTAYSLGHWGTEPFQFFGQIIWGFLTGGFEGAGEIIGRAERSPTSWRPYIWPIKLIMVVGLFLMLLQALSELGKDVLKIRGEPL